MKKILIILLFFITIGQALATYCGFNKAGNKYCSYDNGCYEYWNQNGTHYNSCDTGVIDRSSNTDHIQKLDELQNASDDEYVVLDDGSTVKRSEIKHFSSVQKFFGFSFFLILLFMPLYGYIKENK